MCRKWTWMGWGENKMFLSINKWLFCDGIIPPKKEYDSLLFFWNRTDDPISKSLPSSIFVRCRFSFSYREHTIEKEYSLLCPICKVSMCTSYAYIWFELFEDITETRLRPRTIRYRKRKSHSSSSRMVWILTQYDDPYFLEMCRIKCSEDILPFWKAFYSRVFFFYKICKTLPVWLLKLERKNFMPRWMNIGCHDMIVVGHSNIASIYAIFSTSREILEREKSSTLYIFTDILLHFIFSSERKFIVKRSLCVIST